MHTHEPKWSVKMFPRSNALILITISVIALCMNNLFAKIQPDQPDRLVLTLFDFESEAEIKQFNIRKTNPATVFKLSDQHVTSGKHSVLFSAPSDPKERWPAAITPHLLERRLYLFKDIVTDVYNASEHEYSFDLYFNYQDGSAHAIYNRHYLKPKQQTTVRMLLLPGCYVPVSQMHIFQDQPGRDVVMYIDNMRLESEKFSVLLGNATEEFQQFTKLAVKYPHDRSLQKNKVRLGMELKRLESQRVKDIQWLADIFKFNQNVQQAVRNLNKIAAEIVAKRFKRAAENPTWWYGWTDGMQKIARDSEVPFDLSLDKTIKVSAARNEYEGVQVVLRSIKDLRNVRLEVSDLANAKGDVLYSSNIEILPVGYVNTTKASPTRYRVAYRGWWPDPLLDFLPKFDISAEKWQPVWLDIYVPTGQKEGLYKGTVTASADNAKVISIPIEVRVWNITLPKEQSFNVASALETWRVDIKVYAKDKKDRTEFLEYAQGKKSADELSPAAKRLYELDRQFQDTFLKHRLNPSSIYTWYPQRIDEMLRWKEAGARKLNIIKIPNMFNMTVGVGDKCPDWFKQTYLKIIRKHVPKMKQAGLLENAYVYCFDEIPPRRHAAAIDMLEAIKKEFPDLPIMSTCDDIPEMEGLMDIWVPILQVYDKRKDEIKRPKKNVWPYVCNGPFHPYPNLFIEYSGQGQRLLTGFMPFKYEWGGFLYYEFMGWRDIDHKLFEIIDCGPLTNFSGRGYGGAVNGDGFIFYPGPKGAMSSIRAKCLRDGLEDYEMLCLLRKKFAAVKAGEVSAPEEWVRQAEEVLGVSPELFRSLTDYSADSQNILNERSRIASLLIQGAE